MTGAPPLWRSGQHADDDEVATKIAALLRHRLGYTLHSHGR
jgi:hypothetical protein